MPPSKKSPIQSSKKGVIFDRIDPRVYNNTKLMLYCEQCSHFDETHTFCTIGYDASKHTQAVTTHNYNLMGRIAVCRFMEID
ncbi:MAG: hypothetical protein KDD34_04405 [Bdellovibrionales bacterium]|nr:hypothetical protein [Bdellovibrionales bacterium]